MELSIYVASPLGFSEAGRFFYYEKLLPQITKMGFQVLDPWTLTDPLVIEFAMSAPEGCEQRKRWSQVNKTIGRNNAEAIKKCSLVVAILDGPDVDSGTAAEVGFAAGLEKLVIGYRSDFRLSADNVGSMVNLQVEYFIRKSGGDIVTTLSALEEKLCIVHTQSKNHT